MFDESLGGSLRELNAALDRVAGVDVSAADDRQLDGGVGEIQGLRARVDALEARVVGEWDARGVWKRSGFLTPAAAIATRRRLPVEACRRAPRVARKLRHLPGVLAALEVGVIGMPQVVRILGADNPRTHDALVADHVEITRWATTLTWRLFCRRLQDWVDEHDTDGVEPSGAAPQRRAHCSKTIGDWYAVDGWLDPVGGTIFATELERLERQLYEQDLAEARERLGREPLAGELARSAEQRRADALVLMVQRSARELPEGVRGRALFTVLVGDDSLKRICELTNGIQLRPGQLAPYLHDALMQRVVFDGPTHVIGVSSQRTFTGLLRKAIEARDRHCQFPGCDEPISRCEVDHIIPDAAGGPTAIWNGRLLCGGHNRSRPGATRHGDRSPPGPDAA